MAILAMDSVTIAAVVDVDYVRRYYLLQASTLAAPASPTTNPPLGFWSTTEPGYANGSTNTLYTTDLIVFSDGSFDYLPVQKSSSYEAAKQAWNNAENAKDVAQKAKDEAESRGTDLVTNGTGIMGNNTNFRQWAFDPADAPTGAVGSFKVPYGRAFYAATCDTTFPVNSANTYRCSVRVRQRNPNVDVPFYARIYFFDAAGNGIEWQHCVSFAGTATTLTQPLNNGDTVIHVADPPTNWRPNGDAPWYQQYINTYDYVDAKGRAWPAYTYTRNSYILASGGDYTAGTIASVDVSAKTIALKGPWEGGNKPAGTPISQGQGGDAAHLGIASYLFPPHDWSGLYTATLKGQQTDPFNHPVGKLPFGATKARFSFLGNWADNSAGSDMAFAAVSVSDAAAAQDTADEAKTIANRKTAMYTQPTVPTAPPGGFTVGDIWVDNGPFLSAWQSGTGEDTGGGITKRWNGTSWVRLEQTIDASEIRGGFIKAGIAIWSGGNIVAGNIFGVCAVMDNFGFKTLKVMDDVQYTSLSLGNPAGKDSIEIFDNPANPAVFAVSEKGDVSANDLTLAEDPFIKGKTLLGKVADPASEDGWLDDFTNGIVGFGNFRGWAGDGRKAVAPNATSVTAGIGYMTFQMRAGRSYKVTMPYHYHCTSVIGSAGRCHAYLRYTWGNGGAKPTSVPNDSSTLVALDVNNHTAAASYQSSVLELVWLSPFPVDTWVTIYVSIVASNCTMEPATSSPIGSWIITAEDLGKSPEDTAEKFVVNTPPAQPKSNYVSTWTATASRNYLSNGNPSSLSIDTTRNVLRHGYYDSQAGDSRSAWVVATNTAGVGNDGGKTISAALAGATISKVEIWVQSVHWYYPTGGTLIYRPLKSSTLPATLTNAQAPAEAKSWKFTGRSQGFWIPVPTSWVSASGVGFVYGPTANNSNEQYGYFAGPGYQNANARPKVRISYTR